MTSSWPAAACPGGPWGSLVAALSIMMFVESPDIQESKIDGEPNLLISQACHHWSGILELPPKHVMTSLVK